MENIILFDWLTFTCTLDNIAPNNLVYLLGLEDQDFKLVESYRYGYSKRLEFGGVSILYDGQPGMGICVDCSGTGCRSIETFSKVDWNIIFNRINCDGFNITRLDVAFDDHTGLLDIQLILNDTDDHLYRSRSRWWLVEYGSTGICIYHGSPTSNFRCRIYDKAAERGLTDGTHWIRVEIVLRNVNAKEFVSKICEGFNIGTLYRGVLANYLVYCKESNDSNRSRWEASDYWFALLGSASPIRLWSCPGIEYNVFHLERYLRDQCGGAIYTWSQLYDFESLESLIKTRTGKLSAKHKLLLDMKGKFNL